LHKYTPFKKIQNRETHISLVELIFHENNLLQAAHNYYNIIRFIKQLRKKAIKIVYISSGTIKFN